MNKVEGKKRQVTDMCAPDTNKTDMCVAAPEPWQERMIKEYVELKDRYCKLHRVITQMEAGTCGFKPFCPLVLLQRQAGAMGEYLHVLELRAEIEKVPLPY